MRVRGFLAPVLAQQRLRLVGLDTLGETRVEGLAGRLEQDHELHVLDVEPRCSEVGMTGVVGHLVTFAESRLRAITGRVR